TAADLPGSLVLTPGAVYGTAVLGGTPGGDDIGTYDVTVSVADGGNGDSTRAVSDQRTFHLVVRASNAAPVLPPVGNLTMPEAQTKPVALSATDGDGDALTYSAANIPPFAALDPATGILTLTPNFLQAGVYPGIVLSVTDGNRTVSQTIALTVTN